MSADNDKELQGLTKPKLILLVKELREEQNIDFIQINKKLDNITNKIESLESELMISRKVNTLLKKQIVQLEIQCASNEQYSRRECLEFSGIPETVDDNHLESATLDILKMINVPVEPVNIEACHRVGKKGCTIMKFSRRKDVQKILKSKKKLKDLSLPNNIYINESLCPFNKKILFKCRKLWKDKKVINSFWSTNGTIRIRIIEDGPIKVINHISELEKLFPQIDISNLGEIRA